MLQVDSINPKDGKKELKPFRVVDLLLYPDDYKNAKGHGKIYRNQYHPSYNRLTATLYNVFDQGEKANMLRKGIAPKKWFERLEESFHDSSMVLNLALIDHEFDINKSADDMSVVLTIKYAGYFETALNAPYMDALADKQILEARKKRQEKLKEAMSEKVNCPITLIQKMEQNHQSAQIAEAKMSRRKIVDRLIKRRKLWMIEFDRAAVAEYVMASRTVPTDPQAVWEKATDSLSPVLVKQGTHDASDAHADTTAASIDAIQNAAKDQSSVSKLYYFYLGDLFEIITDCIYKQAPDTSSKSKDILGSKKRDTNIDDLKWMKLYFAAGSFKYKKILRRTAEEDLSEATKKWKKENPQTVRVGGAPPESSEMTYTINILDVPIALDYFKKWFEQTVIKKERNFYPAMAMIRDLVEKVVTNLLNEVCFGNSMGQRLRFKVTSASTATSLGKPGRFGDPVYNEYILQRPSSVLSVANSKTNPLMKHNVKFRTKDYTNYVLIYCQQHNIFDAGIFGGKLANHKENYVPHFDVGRNTNGAVISAAFKRTEVKYLREARYFSGNGANLAQLQNVYAVNGMKLQHNTYMFPGMLAWIEFNSLKQCGGGPALPTSLAYQLGLGGYHMITKVNGTWKPNNNATTTVDAVWTHSGAPEDIRRYQDPKKKSIQSEPVSKQCQGLLDASAQEVEDLEKLAEEELEAQQKIEEEQQEQQSSVTTEGEEVAKNTDVAEDIGFD